MFFLITDNKKTTWAYGDTAGTNPTLADICSYLMKSTHPDIFTIIFFTNTGIVRKVSLIDYTEEIK